MRSADEPDYRASQSGSLIELDQCPRCGGIWCDKWELFPVQPSEASRLEPADRELLCSPLPLSKKEMFCPRCTARLAALREPSLGTDVLLQRCLRCDAIWLNCGQFSRYKDHQKKTRRQKLGAEAEVEQPVDSGRWVVTGTRGMFAYPPGEEENADSGLEAFGAAASRVLQVLLRLLPGR